MMALITLPHSLLRSYSPAVVYVTDTCSQLNKYTLKKVKEQFLHVQDND